MHSPQSHDLEGFAVRVSSKTPVPLYVGFGISDVDRAKAAARVCDGVIIGSALVKLIQSASSSVEAVSNVGGFLAEVKSAIQDVSRRTGPVENAEGA
jgi:tryptophan synthase alpha chain